MMNSEFTLQIPIAGFRAIILTWIGAACFGMQAQAVGTLSSATPSTVELLDEIVTRADSGEWTGKLIHAASRRGMEAAREAALRFDPTSRPRSLKLVEIIANVGRCRRLPAEVLRLYDPVAFEFFYGDLAKRRQAESFAPILAWEQWSELVPEAMVRAAPLLASDWLTRQATAEKPRQADVAALLTAWSRWISMRDERFALDPLLHGALKALLGRGELMQGGQSTIAFLGCVGHAGLEEAIPVLARELAGRSADVRSAAYLALGHMATPAALAVIVHHARGEKDAAVARDIAVALQEYPASEEAGVLALEMFGRWEDPAVRRDLLLSLQETVWPQRSKMILAATRSPADGVLGVALDAVRSGLDDETRSALLKYSTEDPWPMLVDAFGELGDEAAVEPLLRWLVSERNEAIRIKIIVALEKIGGEAAADAIAGLVKTESDADVVLHVLRAAARLEVESSVPTIVALTFDHTAPPDIRAEAIWALGSLATHDGRVALDRLSENPGLLFEAPDDAEPEDLEMARLYVELARHKLGADDAVAALEKLYQDATPANRLIVLVAFGYLGARHPLIASAMESEDFPVVLGAVRSAYELGGYHDELLAMRREPFVDALLATGLQDVATLSYYLERGMARGRQ